ncbi:MAG: hypothetical protein Q8Q14_01405 [Gemmatimonadales bacterium]|nr:hypothetical protein [Gemmatimonadales bacterium]
MAFVARTPDPIEVQTPIHGVVSLRWVSYKSTFALEDLRKEHGATVELVLRALHDHLLLPTPSLEEFRSWPAEDRDALAVAWAGHRLGLKCPIEGKQLPEAFVEAVDRHLEDARESVRKSLSSGFEIAERGARRMMAALQPPLFMRVMDSFIQSQAKWRTSMLGPVRLLEASEEMRKSITGPIRMMDAAARLQESVLPHQTLLLATERHTNLLADMASAAAANARLTSLPSALAAITDGFRAAAVHEAQLNVLAGIRGQTGAAAEALSQGLASLARASHAVWVDWERQATPPVVPWLQEAPGIEVFSASRAAAAVAGSPVENEPTAAIERLELAALRVEPLLERVNPELVTTYRGAAHAIVSGGPDSTRHMATSLRELLTHVLHELAPDRALREWKESRPEDFPNGRPSRALRVRYIFRHLKGTAYEEFVDADVGRTVELIQILHGDTHGLGRSLNPEAQRIVLRTAEGVLAVLLEAAFGERSEH